MRGRRLSAIIAAGLLALVAAGCGGGDDLAPEVPGPPADVVLPDGTVEPAATPEGDDSGGRDAGRRLDLGRRRRDRRRHGDARGGGSERRHRRHDARHERRTDRARDAGRQPDQRHAPPAGSEAEQFEDFCAQNPGAC